MFLFCFVLKIQEAWDDVRLQLRRHLLDRLSPHSPEHHGPGRISFVSIPERVHCLQQLLFLYPKPEVLSYYQVWSNHEITILIVLMLNFDLIFTYKL